ncbi:MAG: AMP-binding protein [Candidatus Hydrogenedentes bacterium]|nr:AMP-binding protein [Candidatus Hydrogenedentota bacterium]
MNPTPDNRNIAAQLPRVALEHPNDAAVIVQGKRGANGRHAYSQWTLAELNAESDRMAHGLTRAGITRGMRTVLMVKPSLEFFALTFALFKTGAIPVMVDPGMGIKNLKTCLDEAAPEAFVGIPKAHVARVLFGWAKRHLKIRITVGGPKLWGGHTLSALMTREATPYPMAPMHDDDLAAILFTSGSTGIPKGAVYTHGIFNAQVEILRKDYGIRPGEKDLATFPLFALFGPALGMAAIVPDMDASKPATANPANIVAAVQDHEATNLFASPALIEIVGRHGEAQGVKLPTLRRVISAGAPADLPSLRRFSTLLNPGVQIYPSYGATESLPVSFIGHDEQINDTAAATDNGAGVCVGRPVEDVSVAIVRITDSPIPAWSEDLLLPQGTIGEICVKGPMVTREYFNQPGATALAKIYGEDGAVYHRMGDVGYIDAQGRLWMCGRKSHRVVTATGTLFTIPCERIFNTHPAVRRTALVGIVKNAKVLPVLCVECVKGNTTPQSEIEAELRALAAQHAITSSIDTFLFHPSFPVDVRHNAKIFREKLTVWAQEKLP